MQKQTFISGYAKAGKALFDMAISSDTYYPIWGTCLGRYRYITTDLSKFNHYLEISLPIFTCNFTGFELLAYLSNEERPNLKHCSSQQQPLALNLTDNYYGSQFAQYTPDDITDILATQKVTINFHQWCLTPENFAKFQALSNFWDVLSTNKDWNGLEFISLMEAKHYPMWASQYHPEKNAFEWTRKYPDIPHFKDAIRAAAHHAEFFVQVSESVFFRKWVIKSLKFMM